MSYQSPKSQLAARRRGRGQGDRAGVADPGEPGLAALERAYGDRPAEIARDRAPSRVVAAPVAGRVHPVGQQDHERVGHRVDHHRGAGVAGVPEGDGRGQGIHVPALVELESEAVGVAGELGVLVDQHRADRVGLEDALVAVAAAVEQGPGEDRQVAGGGEQPGVAGDAAERPGVLVVHLAADHRPIGPRLRLGGRDPVDQARGRVEHRVHHAQRAGDAVGDHPVQRSAGDLLHHQAQGDQAEVGVDVGRAGLGVGLDGQYGGEALLDGLVVAVERQPGRQPAGVGEQVPDRDVVLAVLGEVREVRRDRLVEVDTAGLDLLHHRDRGERLGHRRQVEDGVPPHRHLLVGGELGVDLVVLQGLPGGVVDRDHAVPRGEHHAAGVQRVLGRRGEELPQVRGHLVQGLLQQVRLPGRAGAQLVVLEAQVVGGDVVPVRRREDPLALFVGARPGLVVGHRPP